MKTADELLPDERAFVMSWSTIPPLWDMAWDHYPRTVAAERELKSRMCAMGLFIEVFEKVTYNGEIVDARRSFLTPRGHKLARDIEATCSLKEEGSRDD